MKFKIVKRFEEAEVKRTAPLNSSNSELNYFHLNEKIPSFMILMLNNTFCSPYGILFKNGQVVKQSVYSMFDRNKNHLTFFKKILLGRYLKIKGPALIIHNAYYSNFYHWLIEAMPRLYVSEFLTNQCTLVIPKKVSLFHKQMLDLFKFKNILYLDDHLLVKAETFILPMHTSTGLSHYPQIMRGLRDRILPLVLASKCNKDLLKAKNIYISRGKALKRKIINEQEVLNVLLRHNFISVELESLPFTDQVSLFNNAEVVCGVHGAGLSNMIFSPDKTTYVVFKNEEHPDPAFINLANCFSHNFYLLDCSDPNSHLKGRNPQSYDVQVDTTQLEEILAMIY
ncbi:glycosyltransferase family 61 protein [Reichenbachiella sp. MALMAid0571]|uniref:glycosyltransferase family 61 protein n=1 Tax=Reichenbachiella sp. MALMAid0571 TaxID=3143939 RepID=UPI0032E045BA